MTMFRGGFIPSYDDGFFGSSPFYRSSDPFTPRSAYEEQRRREAYQRARHQEILRQKELQRKREMEALRRKKAEEEYLRRLREAERQEKLRRRPQYQVVRGPDGGLYRVPVYDDESEEDEPVIRPQKRSSSPKYTIVRGPGGQLYRVPSSYVESRDEDEPMVPPQRRSPTPTKPRPAFNNAGHREVRRGSETDYHSADEGSEYHSAEEDDMDIEKSSADTNNRMQVKVDVPVSKDNKKRQVTVIVEDVPEEEAEDEFKSVWRNRRPGPGESWMEPIEQN